MTRALALFSGGLDSLLACRVIAAQGISVQAVKFVTPFFGYELLAKEQEYARMVRERYGIEVVLRDVSEAFFTMLRNPAHGYGKNFNPCVDCKILLLKEAKRLLPEFSASFLITGEVLGQRPMSQRRDTLRVIERDSGCTGILLRPLCAKTQEPTLAEREGLVDRERLLAFNGRGRQPQIQLAKSFGITDYPPPAGGCVLTEREQAKRIAWYYARYPKVRLNDIRRLLFGRHFQLPHGGWLVLGRDEAENARLEALHDPADFLVYMPEWFGPMGVLHAAGHADDFAAAAGLVVRFGKKMTGASARAEVLFTSGEEERRLLAEPLADEIFQGWSLAHASEGPASETTVGRPE
ncbi:MAG: thiamine biosynthesis protein [Deltaproteobacteria bacterium RIFOXYD12_FULL_55_16]|nr:MAG: thiamine biosynthesis protein [Deltaproteobacteria bacterium RIFOXYD12_FULL_55_16]